MRSGLDQFGIGVLKTGRQGRIVETGSMREDIADSGFDCAEQKTVSFVKARDDFRIDSRDQGKGTRRLGGVQLNPGPWEQAQIVIAAPGIPDAWHGRSL